MTRRKMKICLAQRCLHLPPYSRELTCHREDSQVLHRVHVLETEVSDLCAPAQIELQQGRHRGQVTHAYVRNVVTPVRETEVQEGHR